MDRHFHCPLGLFLMLSFFSGCITGGSGHKDADADTAASEDGSDSNADDSIVEATTTNEDTNRDESGAYDDTETTYPDTRTDSRADLPELDSESDSGEPEPSCEDLDNDGFRGSGQACNPWDEDFDCDDANALIHPDAEELCDIIDNNCNDAVDEECECTPGSSRPCGDTTHYCEPGTQSCPNGIWLSYCQGGVMRTTESCNGIDDDCDGEIDEDFQVNQPCTVGLGQCERNGFYICLDGSRSLCNVDPGLPQPELCDGLDNDCDSIVDDGFALGEPCFDGYGGCRVEGVTICREDGQVVVCNADAPPPIPELCDGLDNDCDMYVDEDFNLGSACSVGLGRCQSEGVLVCDDSGTSACDAVRITPISEICDGLDNDCDGSVDEGIPQCCNQEGESISCGIGIGECEIGTQTCTNSSWGACLNIDETPVNWPQTELCDGLDNDCDGSVDEDYPLLGLQCEAGLGDCLSYGHYVCSRISTSTVCDAVAGRPRAEECDHQDNDCDGAVDEGFNLESDNSNCGRCGNICQDGQYCNNSNCTPIGMITVPAGLFWRGCDPMIYECGSIPFIEQEEVSTFSIDVYEVTVSQYLQCVEADRCLQPGFGQGCNWMVPGKENQPMNCVTKEDANTFCRWRGEEMCVYSAWERAARGSDTRPYPWGVAPPTCETTNINSCIGDTVPVDSYPNDVSPYGVMDMGGNVKEWVNGGGSSMQEHYVKGGSFLSPPENTYVFWRTGVNPITGAGPEIGFRCCKY